MSMRHKTKEKGDVVEEKREVVEVKDKFVDGKEVEHEIEVRHEDRPIDEKKGTREKI
jgi:hypothetical protein